MDYHKKYIKYKQKYIELMYGGSALKLIAKGQYTGIKRARNFSEKIINGIHWNKVIFSHGGFIRNVCMSLLSDEFKVR